MFSKKNYNVNLNTQFYVFGRLYFRKITVTAFNNMKPLTNSTTRENT